MELTGKCKVDFEKWLVCGEGWVNFKKYYNACAGNNDPFLWVIENPLSMQYGVYVDFFDSVEVFININTYDYGGRYFQYSVDDLMPDTVFYKRSEAITQSIQKANELYNN